MKSFSTYTLMLASVFTISFSSVNAGYAPNNYVYNDSNECPDWCTGYVFGGDFLWWKPCIDHLDYATRFSSSVLVFDNPQEIERYHYINLDWEPGMRFYIEKEDAGYGWDLSASYTWIYVGKKATAGGTGPQAAPTGTLFSTQFRPSLARADLGYSLITSEYSLQYHTFDLLAKTECCLSKVNVVKPFLGLTGVFLDQKINTRGIQIEGFVNELSWKNCYWGVGFKAGAEYTYEMSCGLSFYALVSGAIVAGDSDTKRREVGDPNSSGNIVTIHTPHDDECVFLNGYHIASGLIYEYRWCDLDLAFRIGYEFVKWHNITGLRRYASRDTSEISVSSSTNSTLGFHGLFVGLSVFL